MHSRSANLPLARLLFEDRNEQGRFLMDVQLEIERQSEIHKKRKHDRFVSTPTAGSASHLQSVASKVFGRPVQWLGSKQPASPSFSAVTCEWLRIHEGVAVAALSSAENVCDSAHAFVYRKVRGGPVRCVALPRMVRNLPGLFEMLGLHRRTQEHAQFTVDWMSQLFRVNGRDTLHWNYG